MEFQFRIRGDIEAERQRQRRPARSDGRDAGCGSDDDRVLVTWKGNQPVFHLEDLLMFRCWRISAGLFLIAAILIGIAACGQPEAEQSVDKAAIRVYFSPGGGGTEAIVQELDRASREIKVQAYSFTSRPIAGALLNAHRRGVKVDVILDKSNVSPKYGAADFTVNRGIPTFIDDQHSIAHNKIMIIDQETVITGSFNFTRAAEEKNAENLLIIREPGIASQYLDNWERHRAHSQVYQKRPDHS
ncbi:MAG: Phospholipase D precursor [Syntrophus sp. PtaB.Bin075]|nr:MAG: Phospholipase D precursor [Syntrophus sp. PtaB.Bin075]